MSDERMHKYARALHEFDPEANGPYALTEYLAAAAGAVMAVANDEQEVLRALLGTVRAAVWADVVSVLNDRAQMWDNDNRPVLARECRDLSRAYSAYARGVGVPSVETLRERLAAAEVELAETRQRLARVATLANDATSDLPHWVCNVIRLALVADVPATDPASIQPDEADIAHRTAMHD